MSRADKYSLEQKKTEIYSDFLNSFDLNPVTGFLARLTNEESVKQSVKNLMLTSIGERFYNTSKGSKIRNSLFDNFDPTNLELIKMQASEVLQAYEPRARVHAIRLNEDLDRNAYNITFVFSIINIPDQTFDLTINVKRVR
jgi:hypothetical protein